MLWCGDFLISSSSFSSKTRLSFSPSYTHHATPCSGLDPSSERASPAFEGPRRHSSSGSPCTFSARPCQLYFIRHHPVAGFDIPFVVYT